MDILFSIIIALIGTFGILVAFQGVQSRRTIIIISIVSFVLFYWLTSYFGLSELVLKIALG